MKIRKRSERWPIPTNHGKPRLRLSVEDGYVPKQIDLIIKDAAEKIVKFSSRYSLSRKDACLLDGVMRERFAFYAVRAMMHLAGDILE